MPFKSQAQRRFMYAKHPGIAKRWQKESGTQKELPEKVSGWMGLDDDKKKGGK